jgi:hypothetical protein
MGVKHLGYPLTLTLLLRMSLMILRSIGKCIKVVGEHLEKLSTVVCFGKNINCSCGDYFLN